MKIRVYVVGCDDTTIVELEATEQEVDFAQRLAELVTKTSTYGCEPTMQVEEI